MTQRSLWYASLVIEAILLGILIAKRQCFAFGCWLAFDVSTGALNVWMDKAHWQAYEISWSAKQPIAMGLRVMAARDVWNRLGGPVWARTCMGIAAFISIAQMHGWPKTVIEAEFSGIAVGSAALGMILWFSIRAASKLKTDPFVLTHGYVMCAYFLLSALCYFAAWGYRDTIGLATGIVAIFAYATWTAVVWRNRFA
jgi:hypothetical protein